MADFDWTKNSEQAALDLALGSLTDEVIAERAEISARTLYKWKLNPEFAARVEEHLDVFRQRIRRQGLAILERRVDSLNDRWRRLQEVIRARADDPSMAKVPGGNTGLLVRSYKQIGSGDSAQVVEEYEVDAALLRESREHEKQAAQELGQWTEKKEVSGDAEKPVVVKVLKGITMDEI